MGVVNVTPDSFFDGGRYTVDKSILSQAEKMLKPADHALAIAIAGEALRRLPDIDALIDSATRQKLPDDSKARMVLRLRGHG